MKQTKSVSWRTSAIALCACLLASGVVVFFTRQNTIKPNELSSSTAAHWLVHRASRKVVLVDGFSGRVLARVDAGEDADDAVTVQGEGGAFLVSNSTGTARSISTAKLRLGTSRKLEALTASQANVGVGVDGLTAVDGRNALLDVLSTDAVPRSITPPVAGESIVTNDGSVWLLANGKATHVRIDDRPIVSFDLPGTRDDDTYVGADALTLDRAQRIVHWLGGADVSIGSFAATRSAVLQEPGPAATCVWIGSGDELACVDHAGIDQRVTVQGLQIDLTTRFAMLDSTIVVVRGDNTFDRFDLRTGQRLGATTNPPSSDSPLAITATDEVIWLDDPAGDLAWVIQRFGQRTVDKQDVDAPQFSSDGQSTDGDGNGGSDGGGGAADQGDRPLDDNGVDDPPIAVDDELTAGADKQSITIPVADNDYDPDGDAIAVLEVEPAGHGDTYVLNATTVVYVPKPGRSGLDSFSYTITDQNGNEDTAEVRLEIFSADHPNEPPETTHDDDETTVGVPVEIDVLANDIDPERDDLDVTVVEQPESGRAEVVGLDSGRPGIRYTPDDGTQGRDSFTYFASDSKGLRSDPTEVKVTVSPRSATNRPPVAEPNAVRVRIDKPTTVAVLDNDTDLDNDLLTVSLPPTRPPGMTIRVVGNQLQITARAGLPTRSTFTYVVTDSAENQDTGTVLVLLDDPTEPNRPPVANQDSNNVVEGSQVVIEVLSNDTDPDADQISLRSVTQPDQRAGVVAMLDDGKVKFTSTATGLTKPTPVTFTYEIADPDDLRATGIVVVTVAPADAASPMVAADDEATVRAGGSTSVDVLNNDTTSAEPKRIGGDISCRPGLSAELVDDQVQLTADLTATPGRTTCRYQAIDALESSDSAFINVTIEPASDDNNPPRQRDDSSIRVVAGAGVASYDLTARVIDDEGDALQFARVSPSSSRGQPVTIDDNSLRYAPPLTPGPDTVSLTVTDGINPAVTFSISFDVQPKTNLKPVAAPLTDSTFDRSVRLDWRTPAAAEGSDKSTLQASIAGAGGNDVEPPVNSNGSFVITAKPNFYGVFRTTYTIRDADGLVSDFAPITVTFRAPDNIAPTAKPDSLTVDANGRGTVDVLANDDDDDLATLQAVLTSPASSAIGEATLTPQGVFTFTAKPSEDGGTAVFGYRVQDTGDKSDESTITVTVRACAQRTPVINAPDLTVGLFERPVINLQQYVTNGTVYAVDGGGLTSATGRLAAPAGSEEDVIITFSAKNSCDLSTAGSLRVHINRPPVANAVSRSIGRGTTLTLPVSQLASDDPGETLLIDPLPAAAPSWVDLSSDRTTITASPPLSVRGGTFSFTAVIRDPGSGRVDIPITIEVVNQAPIAAPDTQTTEIDAVSLDPRVNDVDPEGSGLTIVSAAVRSGQADVAVFEDHVTITNLSHGVVEVNYTIRDQEGALATSFIRIIYNRAPDARNESFVMYESIFTFELPATDPDGDPMVVIAAGPDDFTTTTAVVDGKILMTLRANREFDLGTKIYFFYSVVDPFGEASEAIIFLELQIPSAATATT